MSKTTNTLAAARERDLAANLDALAEAMFEPGKVWNSDLKEEVDGNILHYPQKRILNGLAYAAVTSLRFAEERVDEQKRKVADAIRTHRNDEISEQKLNRAMDWMENLDLQVAVLTQFRDEAIAAYARHTGETFAEPKPRTRVEGKFQSSAMERAAKMGLLNEELTQGGGIEVAA